MDEHLRLLLKFVSDLSTHELLEKELDELCRLATIGAATEKAFELYIVVDASTFDIKTVAGDSNELLAWYAQQKQEGTK